MSTYTLYRAVDVRADSLATTITTARDKYLARQGRPATEARVHSSEVAGLGLIAGVVIVPDDRVHQGEVWLTSDSSILA